MCPALTDAVLTTAGHDEIRGSGPDQIIALAAHDNAWVFPIPGLTEVPSRHSSPSHVLFTVSGD